MDAVSIGLAVQRGVSIICATCRRYWEARERGVPEDRCMAPERSCGSPLAGMAFPLYEGPITDFNRWCFVCGQTAKYGIKFRGGRVFGMCEEHVGMIGTVTPVGLDGIPVADILASKAIDRDKLLRVPRKSLLTAISEVEASFSKNEN